MTIIGCSESENNDITFEQQIRDVLDKENVAYDNIIDYDLKDDYIFVYYRTIAFGNLSVSIIKQQKEGMEFVKSEEVLLDTTVVSDGISPFVTIVKPSDFSVKRVEVQGKPARQVTFVDNAMEGVTLEIRYWVAYSYTNPFEEVNLIRE